MNLKASWKTCKGNFLKGVVCFYNEKSRGQVLP